MVNEFKWLCFLQIDIWLLYLGSISMNSMFTAMLNYRLCKKHKTGRVVLCRHYWYMHTVMRITLSFGIKPGCM